MNLSAEISDYREILKAYYDRRKKEMPFYSYRMMGDRLGLDSSYLFRVLQKKAQLPAHSLEAVKEMLGLSGRSAEYFNLLYAACVSKNPQQKKELMAKTVALRDVERRSLQLAELKALENWWIPAVRSFLELNGGVPNFRQIASSICPPISEAQAKDAVEILEQVGLLKKLSSGRLALTESHLTVGGKEKARAVRNFQRQALSLAIDSLDSVPVAERNVSTLTMAVDSEAFEDLSEMLKEFRRRVQKRVDSVRRPDRIMQLSLAFYPVARAGES